MALRDELFSIILSFSVCRKSGAKKQSAEMA
jgi:hypothetical protein